MAFCGLSEEGELGEMGRRGKERGQVYSIATPGYDLHVTTLGVARISDGAVP